MGIFPLVDRAQEFSEVIACIGSNAARLQRSNARRYQYSDLADIPILAMVENTEGRRVCEVLITLQRKRMSIRVVVLVSLRYVAYLCADKL